MELSQMNKELIFKSKDEFNTFLEKHRYAYDMVYKFSQMGIIYRIDDLKILGAFRLVADGILVSPIGEDSP